MQFKLAAAGLLGMLLVFSAVEGSEIRSVDDLEKAVIEDDIQSIKMSEKYVKEILTERKGYCNKEIYTYDISGSQCGGTIFEFALENQIDYIVKECLRQNVKFERDMQLFCLKPLEIAFYSALDENDPGASKSLEYVEWLLKAGADPNYNLPTTGALGATTLLIEAAAEGNKELVALLLKYGADPSKQDSYGNTAMHLAVQHCDEELIKMIYKADSTQGGQKNFDGQTPLEVAGDVWEDDETCKRRIVNYVTYLTEGKRAYLKSEFKDQIGQVMSWYSRQNNLP